MPAAIPVTIPPVPTVALLVLLLLHVPPDVASVKPAVNPAHTIDVPLTADGYELIITVALPVAPHTPATERALK